MGPRRVPRKAGSAQQTTLGQAGPGRSLGSSEAALAAWEGCQTKSIQVPKAPGQHPRLSVTKPGSQELPEPGGAQETQVPVGPWAGPWDLGGECRTRAQRGLWQQDCPRQSTDGDRWTLT